MFLKLAPKRPLFARDQPRLVCLECGPLVILNQLRRQQYSHLHRCYLARTSDALFPWNILSFVSSLVFSLFSIDLLPHQPGTTRSASSSSYSALVVVGYARLQLIYIRKWFLRCYFLIVTVIVTMMMSFLSQALQTVPLCSTIKTHHRRDFPRLTKLCEQHSNHQSERE